jgi:phosphate-selective porin OprO/OprP
MFSKQSTSTAFSTLHSPSTASGLVRTPSGSFGGLPVAQNVNQGGSGAWELGLRVPSIDLTDGDIAGGEMDVATAQVAWWATGNMSVSLNYRRTRTDRFGLDGEMDATSARVALFLQ